MRSNDKITLPVTWGEYKSFVIFYVMYPLIRSVIWHLRAIGSPRLDHAGRAVYLRGKSTCLQDTAWNVLVRLQSSAPDAISRRRLIEEIWGSRWRTGEKGLNQAIWQIRTALSEDARTPRYIQTIPRKGYRWLGPSGASTRTVKTCSLRNRAFYFAAILLLPMSLLLPSNSGSNGMVSDATLNPDRTAVAAYLDPLKRIVVDLEGGCRGLIVPSEGKLFGPPAISADGGAVAFTVKEVDSCKTVTVQLSDYSRQEFENCRVDI